RPVSAPRTRGARRPDPRPLRAAAAFRTAVALRTGGALRPEPLPLRSAAAFRTAVALRTGGALRPEPLPLRTGVVFRTGVAVRPEPLPLWHRSCPSHPRRIHGVKPYLESGTLRFRTGLRARGGGGCR